MRKGKIFKKILGSISSDEMEGIKAFAVALLEGGQEEEEIIEELVELMDDLVNFHIIFAHNLPLAAALEAIDGIVFGFIAKKALQAAKRKLNRS